MKIVHGLTFGKLSLLVNFDSANQNNMSISNFFRKVVYFPSFIHTVSVFITFIINIMLLKVAILAYLYGVQTLLIQQYDISALCIHLITKIIPSI